MIASCPKCNTRYRVDPEKLGAEGARLRCTKCEAVFRVRAPASLPAPAQSPQMTQPVAPANPPAPKPEAPVDAACAVLVADPDVDSGKRTASAIAELGLTPLLVHDGVEAILAIQRNMPDVAIIDAALPKMFGFQVCEMVKRNESLQHIKIVLVGAIHHADRYRRPPSELYGADAYLEQPDLPEGIAPILTRLGLTIVTPAAAAGPPPIPAPMATPPLPPIPAPVAAPPPIPEPVAAPPQPPPIPEPVAAPPPPIPEPVAAPPQAAAPLQSPPQPQLEPAPAPAPEAPAEDDPNAAERAKAERLARIIVSDIVLYHPEKFESAVRAGNVADALGSDLTEGRALFNQRIDSVVRDERDFLMLELERVAEERSK